MTKSNKQIQRDYRARQKEKGFVLFREWIPKEKFARLKECWKQLLGEDK